MTLKQLALRLRSDLGKPVMDATGLPGYFDIDLQFSSSDLKVEPGAASEVPLPPLPTALRTQLGLVLEARKVDVEFLVVDAGEKLPIEK